MGDGVPFKFKIHDFANTFLIKVQMHLDIRSLIWHIVSIQWYISRLFGSVILFGGTVDASYKNICGYSQECSYNRYPLYFQWMKCCRGKFLPVQLYSFHVTIIGWRWHIKNLSVLFTFRNLVQILFVVYKSPWLFKNSVMTHVSSWVTRVVSQKLHPCGWIFYSAVARWNSKRTYFKDSLNHM